MKYLKKIRTILALIFFLPIVLFFVDFTGKLPLQFHQFMMIQLIPALLSLNVLVIVILLILSLLFGRIYCSVICPLGVFQDGISRLSGFFRKKKEKIPFQVCKTKQYNSLFHSGSYLISFCFG
jgi:polyferredoxin